MRFRKIIPLLIGVLLVALLCACAAWDNPSIDMMKKVPVDSTSLDYWAIERLANDEDLLEDVYTKFRESLEAKQLMNDIGVLLASVEHCAKVSGVDQEAVTVLTGSFNIEDIERSLEEKDYQPISWQEVDIWTPQDDGQGYKSVALLEDTILMGSEENLKPCIDTIVKEEEEDSLYKDSHVKAVADKLPDGVIIAISKADSEEKYDNLVAYGKSYSKESEGETVKLKLTAIYMFQDDPTAGQAQDKIKDYLGTKAFTDIEVKREDNFVRATALIYVSDFAQSLAF